MRLTATRRTHWAHLGMAAATMLLPPLALGAIFYAMLPPDEEDLVRSAAIPAAVGPAPAASGAATHAAAPIATDPAGAATAPGAGRDDSRAPAMQPPESQRGETAKPGSSRIPAAATRTAAASNPPPDALASAALPAAESLPAPMAARKPARRHAQKPPPEDPYPVRTWLQQIGLWPRADFR